MRTKKILTKAAVFCLLFVNVALLNAQVTIGSAEVPASGTLLQLKDISNITDDSPNATKGLAMPRVMLSDKNQLFPMFLNNPANPDSGATAEYKANKDMLDKTHTGLVVYNVVEDEDKDLCLGLNVWDGEQWSCVQASKVGSAQFAPVDCADITVNGVYVEGTPAGFGNFLTVNLEVTRPGEYTIFAVTENGYNFFVSGTALSVGKMTVNIPCQGTPANVQIDKPDFIGIELTAGCKAEVEVVAPIAEYALNCSNISVNGQYVKGTALTAQNTITLNVTVGKGGSYNISTPATYGIRFSGSGVFPSAGTHTVTLFGSGTPTVNTDFPITIQTNTLAGNDACTAEVPLTLPAMTYAIIGWGTWSFDAAQRRAAFNNAAFGPDGMVRMVSFDMLWSATNAAAAVTAYNNNAKKPDVILYFAYGASPNAALTALLADYVKAGGSLIFGAVDNDAANINILLNGIFGSNPNNRASNEIAWISNTEVYQINNISNCPIINGPFGNLAGRYWGEDNLGTVIVTELPPNSVQIASARSASKLLQNPNHSVVWYNDTYNFVYFGDCTGVAGSALEISSSIGWPAVYVNGIPQAKLYGNIIAQQWVVNAPLEMNAVAWAVRKAAVSGINPH